MLEAFRLIPALQVIFTSEIEFNEDSFEELTDAQYAAFVRDFGKQKERVYRIVLIEPTEIKRTPEKVTMELNIVMESQKQLLYDGVAFVYRASATMPESNPTFAERLAYLRPKLPPIAIGPP